MKSSKKYHIYALIVILISLAISSCSNEESNSTKETELITVTTNYYANNEIWEFSKSTYANQKLQRVTNLDESYTDYTYNNHLIATASNYQSDGILISTFRYTFDSSDRLTNFDIVSNANEVTKYTITYNENTILYSYKDYNGKSLVYEFGLNSNKQIISRKTISVNSAPPKANALRYQFTYNGLNLATVTSFSPETNVTTPLVSYTYGQLKNETDPNKYIYGKAWKMNSFFIGLIFGANYTPKASENLVSDYRENGRDATFRYELDNDGKIIKSTNEYMTSWNVNLKIEDIYEYK